MVSRSARSASDSRPADVRTRASARRERSSRGFPPMAISSSSMLLSS